MKIQALALGLTLAVAGSAFAATVTQERTVTHVTPHGTVTKHVVRTSERHPAHRVVVVDNHHRHHMARKVVVVRPAPRHHNHVAVERHVTVVHRG